MFNIKVLGIPMGSECTTQAHATNVVHVRKTPQDYMQWRGNSYIVYIYRAFKALDNNAQHADYDLRDCSWK